MGHVNEQNNFLYLTASLIGLLFISSLAATFPPGSAYWIFKLMDAGTVFIAYLSLNFGPIWRRLNIALLVMIATSSFVQGFLNWQIHPLFDLVVMLVFFMAAAIMASTRVLLVGEVDGNKIVGAVAIYLLIGLIWATFYLIILEFSPTAFNGMEHFAWEDNFSKATYFSYVTLTTLGYGDISPAEPLSRVLVYLEAMVGTFYMAVVIASLISSHVSKRNSNNR